jgi:hypothetical protein
MVNNVLRKRRIEKHEIIINEIVNRIEKWKESKTIPKDLKPREIDKWKSNVYIWQEGKDLMFSGGCKIFYYIVSTLHEDKLGDYISWILKHRNYNQFEEALKIRKREKLFGINVKIENTCNGFKDFDKLNIIIAGKSLVEKK